MADPVIAEPDGAVRFGLLGPLQVIDGAGVVRAVHAAKQRIVLATLLLSADQVLPAGALAEALWDFSPPPNASAAMRTYVMRLRRALGPIGARIVGGPACGWGVQLHSSEELDLAEVESLWGTARAEANVGHWQQVSSLLNRALGMWRGEPLIDVPSPALVRRDLVRLAELRLELTEARIDADLRLGRHDALVPELHRLIAEHPLREHIRVQLMLACYRGGHQAAALQTYRDARSTLAGELGVDPGHELQQVYRQILAADPALTAGVPASITSGEPGGRHRQPTRNAVVPRQLPRAVPHFTGRAAELARLTELADQPATDGTGAIAVITGMAGTGKTALAVRWSHQAAALFPDGQLFVNLRGFDPADPPMDPLRAIRLFLEALQVPSGQVPAAAEAQMALYRSLVADKRVVIVADNAHDSGQVRPLLPGSPHSMIIVTSRDELTSLVATEGACPLKLEMLTACEAAEFLSARLGSGRVAAEPDAVAELIRLSGQLPLALAVIAAFAAASSWPLATLVAQLAGADAGRRLEILNRDDATEGVRAAFSWSYQQLTPPAAKMFRLMGIHAGPDITAPAAASLADIPLTQALQALAELVRTHMATEHAPGRYALHDLLRAYAADQALATETEQARHEAIGRMLDHYLHTAHAADHLLYPTREPSTSLVPPKPGVRLETLSDRQQALEWFQTEHQVLLAAIALAARAGFDTHAWQLPWAMADFLDWRGHWHDWLASQRTALAAAQRLQDLGGQARAHHGLASAHTSFANYDEARRHLTECLGLYRHLGDRVGEAIVHQTFGWTFECQERHADALDHAEMAFAIYRAVRHEAGQAGALSEMGWCHAMLGHAEQARTFCHEALGLQRELGIRHGEAHTWDSLGYVEGQLGDLTEAAECYRRALTIFRELGDCFNEAETLTRLGDIYHAFSSHKEAHDAWQQALDILNELGHPNAAEVRTRLCNLGRATDSEEGAGLPP